MRPTLLAVLLCLTPLFAFGANSAANEEKLYRIDALVFERSQAPDTSNESFPAPAARAPMATIEPLDAVRSSRLAAAAAELNKGETRVLVHKSWIQSAEDKDKTKPARLYTSSGDLDGTVQFYVSRFLHVDVNLQLLDRSDAARAFQMRERRRIKTLETNYFDHPKFGLLLYITPVTATGEVRR